MVYSFPLGRIRLDEVVARVKDVAQGATLQVGATMEWEEVKGVRQQSQCTNLERYTFKNAGN